MEVSVAWSPLRSLQSLTTVRPRWALLVLLLVPVVTSVPVVPGIGAPPTAAPSVNLFIPQDLIANHLHRG